MKYFLLITMTSFSLMNISCSKANEVEHTNKVEMIEKKRKISNEDQAIILEYKNLINGLDLSNPDNLKIAMKNSLAKINKIQDKYEREKIQMNIYLGLNMYKDAYDLNEKQSIENPTIENLVVKCELEQTLKFNKSSIQKCNSNLAKLFKEELGKESRDNPLYIYGEWGYLLAMYKAGHTDYKSKIEHFIDSIEDETIKYQFQSSYELALEQTK